MTTLIKSTRNDFRYWSNKQFNIARARKELCNVYRQMRHNGRPEMARILYKHNKYVSVEMDKVIANHFGLELGR